MKYLLLSLSLFILIQEKSTPTTPISLGSITDYQVTSVSVERPWTIGTPGGQWSLTIVYVDNKGNNYRDYHQGVFNASTNPSGADQLVIALNKANLTIKSLNCRAIEHLQSENKIPAASTNDCTPQ